MPNSTMNGPNIRKKRKENRNTAVIMMPINSIHIIKYVSSRKVLTFDPHFSAFLLCREGNQPQ